MIAPSFPENERQRQKAVESYNLLDTLPEEQYNEITTLVSFITDAPISLITLLDHDRNFFKSHLGIPFNESPRDISFCGHAINSAEEITIIEDSRLDKRFKDNPLVTENQAVFYAGVPLVNHTGYKLGTLCAFDTKPRTLDEKQIKTLKVLANQVVSLFEQRLLNIQLQEFKDELLKRNDDLKKFANVVSHDLKSPLANITSLTELIEEDLKGKLTDESSEYLKFLKTSSNSLRDYIDGLLVFYKNSNLEANANEFIGLDDLMNNVKNIAMSNKQDVSINYNEFSKKLFINKPAISQILVNLITNAIKYNDKDEVIVDVLVSENENDYIFEVKDNGIGIAPDKLDSVFDLFSAFGVDRFNNKGTGIGLASVKQIIESLNGTIQISSKLNFGTQFTFNIPKP